MSIIILGLTSFLSYEKLTNVYYRINVLPATLIIDAIIILISFSAITKKQNSKAFYILILCIVYILINVILLIFDANISYRIKDFLLWFKPYYYLIILAYVCSRSQFIDIKFTELIFKFLLVIALLKYNIARFIFNIPRPGLFTENNFEIILFVILYIFLQTYKRVPIYWSLSLALLIILSGSKSGFLILLFAIVSIQKKVFHTVLICTVLIPAILLITFAISPRIFEILDITSLDRFMFLSVFYSEFMSNSTEQMIFGRYPMTPLGYESCTQLNFYKNLFSDFDTYTCFPVILHSFFLKSVLEHGILGVFFIIVGYYGLLRVRGYAAKLTVTLVVLLCLNGLSVSGFSNTYAMFGLTLLMLTKLPTSEIDKLRKKAS